MTGGSAPASPPIWLAYELRLFKHHAVEHDVGKYGKSGKGGGKHINIRYEYSERGTSIKITESIRASAGL